MIDCKVVRHPNGLKSIANFMPDTSAVLEAFSRSPRCLTRRLSAVVGRMLALKDTPYLVIDRYIDTKRLEKPTDLA